MNRKYSPEQRAAALARLAQNQGNTGLTAAQLGIPVRTLRDWRHDAWIASQLARLSSQDREADINQIEAASAARSSLGLPPTPTPSRRQPPQFEDDVAALEFVRRQMLDELLSSSIDWSLIFAVMPPYQRAQIAIMLLDRLMKLDEHLKPYRPQPQYEYYLEDSEGEEPRSRKDSGDELDDDYDAGEYNASTVSANDPLLK